MQALTIWHQKGGRLRKIVSEVKEINEDECEVAMLLDVQGLTSALV